MAEIAFNPSEVAAINRIVANLNNNRLSVRTRVLEFMNNLLELVYFDRSAVIFYYLDDEGCYNKQSSISINWEDAQDYIKRYNEYYCKLDDIFPAVDMNNFVSFISSSFFNSDFRKKTEYWQEYLEPNNCIYSIDGNLLIENPSGLKACFNFFRGREKQDFSEKDLQIIKLLQPHLSRCLRDYGHEQDSAGILTMLEDNDCVGFGVFSGTYSLIRSNYCFRSMIENRSEELLDQVISLCKSLETHEQNGDIINGEYKFDEYSIIMKINRVHSIETDDNQYYVMMYDLSYLFSMALSNAKAQFIFTEREFEILKLVLAGDTNEMISNKLFISIPTIKKHLASIYKKMEISSQKQILSKLNLI